MWGWAAVVFRGPSCERVSEAVPPFVSSIGKMFLAINTSPEWMYCNKRGRRVRGLRLGLVEFAIERGPS